jgi:hypothetical protein
MLSRASRRTSYDLYLQRSFYDVLTLVIGAGGWLDQARASGNAETLDSYLIRPVQRIPRYIMLLADMAKHTRYGSSGFRVACS